MNKFKGKNVSNQDLIIYIKEKIKNADAILVGAGAGLSTSAGFDYSGKRYEKYFSDFKEKYGISDMYSGGFYPFEKEEVYWAWWSRQIYINRYVDPPSDLYSRVLNLVEDKNYFVITTNVDHQFQKAGFDKSRLFYTQGDYGLFQSVKPKINKTYDNEDIVYKMLESQGFKKDDRGIYVFPEDRKVSMEIDSDLIPKNPDDGSKMTMNLRIDSSFVEDDGWKKASERYREFLKNYKDKNIVFLELGVGMNTPSIIKFPFWNFVRNNKKSFYISINKDIIYDNETRDRSIYLNEDIKSVIEKLVD